MKRLVGVWDFGGFVVPIFDGTLFSKLIECEENENTTKRTGEKMEERGERRKANGDKELWKETTKEKIYSKLDSLQSNPNK